MSDQQQHPDPAPAATLTRLIPDLDDELVAALWRIEELLLTLATWAEDDPDDVVVLPAPLGGRVALDALHRVQDELTPTQSRTHPSAAELPRLFGPDGCFEHRPLRLVEVAPHDLAMLAAAAAQLGHALALVPGSELADAIEAGAEAAYPTRSPDPSTGVELVETFARINGLLDLATTADTEMVTRRLWADGCSDIVLTIDEEIAYTPTRAPDEQHVGRRPRPGPMDLLTRRPHARAGLRRNQVAQQAPVAARQLGWAKRPLSSG